MRRTDSPFLKAVSLVSGPARPAPFSFLHFEPTKVSLARALVFPAMKATVQQLIDTRARSRLFRRKCCCQEKSAKSFSLVTIALVMAGYAFVVVRCRVPCSPLFWLYVCIDTRRMFVLDSAQSTLCLNQSWLNSDYPTFCHMLNRFRQILPNSRFELLPLCTLRARIIVEIETAFVAFLFCDAHSS
jgi:hypothetical protein